MDPLGSAGLWAWICLCPASGAWVYCHFVALLHQSPACNLVAAAVCLFPIRAEKSGGELPLQT
jgi:hypothetical protein